MGFLATYGGRVPLESSKGARPPALASVPAPLAALKGREP